MTIRKGFFIFSTVVAVVFITAAAPSEVEIISRASLTVDQEIKINWSVEDISSRDIFIVERSNNGTSFEELKKISASTGTEDGFEVLDRSPSQGTSYYRITQLQQSGLEVQSEVMAIDLMDDSANSCTIVIEPDPCVPSCIAKLTDCDDPTIEVKVMDASGNVIREVIQLDKDTSKEDFSFFINKENNLSPGIYFVSARNHGKKLTKKVMVK